jgi:hypothetical protein
VTNGRGVRFQERLLGKERIEDEKTTKKMK